MRLHKIKCKTTCSPEKNLLPLLSCLPVNAHVFVFLLMPLRTDPNYPSAVKHLFLHSHGPAARPWPGKPLGMSLVTLSCHRYTDHPSLPFVNKARLSMVPVWENLFSLFYDKCEGHYLRRGQRYWMLLMRNQLDVGIQKVEIVWLEFGQRMLFVMEKFRGPLQNLVSSGNQVVLSSCNVSKQ